MTTIPKAIAIVVAAACVFAGFASWGVYRFLKRQTLQPIPVAGDNVVAAARDLAVGTRIEAADLKVMTWPKGDVPAGGFSTPQTVVGRTAVRPMSVGDIITEAKLIPREGHSGTSVMTYLVPKGHRAVTVSVNEVAGVAGFIAPNNRVDVVLTIPLPTAASESISKIVLQDVPVLAVGQIAEQKDGKPSVVPTVTLDLAPDDAEKIVLATHRGSLQLLLRNVSDTAKVEPRGATIGKVLSGLGVASKKASTKTIQVAKVTPPPSAPPPQLPVSVEVIRGKERSTNLFPELAAMNLPSGKR